MISQVTSPVKQPYCVFTTQERGIDHGPVYCVTFLIRVGTRTQVSQPVEIDVNEYDQYLSLPGEWQEGDYWIDQEADCGDISGCTSVKDLWIEQNLREQAHRQGGASRRVVMVQNLDGTQEIDGDFATKYPEYALGVKVSPREMRQSDEDYFQQLARGM